jgi:hypothetical protein
LFKLVRFSWLHSLNRTSPLQLSWILWNYFSLSICAPTFPFNACNVFPLQFYWALNHEVHFLLVDEWEFQAVPIIF